MNRIITPLSILLLTVCCSFAQQKKPVLLKSTITSVSSSTVLLASEKYNIQQSIGQSGIIGKVNSNNTVVQQGFLNGVRFFTLDNSDTINFEEKLEVVVSPNPFTDYIKISFSSKTKHPIHLRVFDTNGKVLIYKKHQASEHIIVPMKNIIIGAYFLHIVSGEDRFVEKILKVR